MTCEFFALTQCTLNIFSLTRQYHDFIHIHRIFQLSPCCPYSFSLSECCVFRGDLCLTIWTVVECTQKMSFHIFHPQPVSDRFLSLLFYVFVSWCKHSSFLMDSTISSQCALSILHSFYSERERIRFLAKCFFIIMNCMHLELGAAIATGVVVSIFQTINLCHKCASIFASYYMTIILAYLF